MTLTIDERMSACVCVSVSECDIEEPKQWNERKYAHWTQHHKASLSMMMIIIATNNRFALYTAVSVYIAPCTSRYIYVRSTCNGNACAIRWHILCPTVGMFTITITHTSALQQKKNFSNNDSNNNEKWLKSGRHVLRHISMNLLLLWLSSAMTANT